MTKTSGTYKVGYCKPPIEHRFEKGHSGNPRGRTKRPRDFATLLEEKLDQIVRPEGHTAISLRQLAFRRLCERCLAGERKALLQYVKMRVKLEPKKETRQEVKFVVWKTLEEATAAMERRRKMNERYGR